jgi:hypothetical protein
MSFNEEKSSLDKPNFTSDKSHPYILNRLGSYPVGTGYYFSRDKADHPSLSTAEVNNV